MFECAGREGDIGVMSQNYICPLRNAAQSGDDDSVEWNATGDCKGGGVRNGKTDKIDN